MLQHNIEAVHRLTIIEGVPVVVFSRDELSEETMLPSGSFELFWYAYFNKRFYGDMVVLADLEDIERDVNILLEQATKTLIELKKQV